MQPAAFLSLTALFIASLAPAPLALLRVRNEHCACNLPLGTIEHTLISRYNAQVESPFVATRMTIGGDMITVSTEAKEADGLVTVGGLFRPYHALQWKFRTNPTGMPVMEDFSQVFKWSEFQELVGKIVPGHYAGETGDGCDDYHVFVRESGGSFDTESFLADSRCQQQGTGENNGRTLVIFKTQDDVTLNPTIDGNGFGPSVLAPFSKVTLSENASFMDGFLVAKSAVMLGRTSALHGEYYSGPLDCECPASSPTTSPTASPTTPRPKIPGSQPFVVTASPTMSPTLHSVSGEADPHLVNVKSERFDVMKPGIHTFLLLPRGATEDTAAFLLRASVTARGDVCVGKLYITGINISGSWLGSVGHLHLSTQGEMLNRTREVLGLSVAASSKMSVEEFLAAVPAKMVKAHQADEASGEVRALNQHVTMLSLSLTFGPGVIVRVDWEHEKERFGYSNWLKLSSWGLSRAKMRVGGLLGEDDHESVVGLPEECLLGSSRSTLRGSKGQLRAPAGPAGVTASASMGSSAAWA